MKKVQEYFSQAGPLRERFRILAPLALAGALTLWASQRWIRSVSTTTMQARNIGRLEQELGTYELFEATARARAIEGRHADLKGRLVDGVEGARAWLTRVSSTSEEYGFQVRFVVGASERLACEEPGVDLVPVDFEFRPLKPIETGPSSSARLVALIQDLEADPALFQVVRLVMTGSVQGLASASIATRLWVLPPRQ